MTLEELYKKEENKIIQVRETFPNEDLGGPLLLNVNQYFNQAIKLMIIGQETFGWDCNYNDQNSLLNTYKNFNFGEHYRSSPFWNIIRKLENLIGIPNFSIAWSNINRFDHNGKEPKGDVLQKIEELDYLLKEEISILKPDICFFMTNRKYDYRIKKLFKDVVLEPVDGLPFNHFVKLNHPDLPSHCYRTPHPRTIRMRKWETTFFKVLDNILPKIEKR